MDQPRLLIAVVEGGASAERQVSLATGSAVREALKTSGHQVLAVELKGDGLTWKVGDFEAGAAACFAGPLSRVDLVFLALHGGMGEGGALQGLLESLGVKHTGSSLAASALALDKLACLRMLEAEGFCTAARQVLTAESSQEQRNQAQELGRISGGLVIKPRRGGSSVATAVIPEQKLSSPEFDEALKRVFALPDHALVEARIDGLEVTCGVLENQARQPTTLPVVEIHPKAGHIFDYEEKYSESGAREVCPPETVSADQIHAIEQAALRAHIVVGAKGYSRSDFILPESAPASPIFLEINTLPGLTTRSLLPLSARQRGLSFEQLCERIVCSAWQD